jgi:hypothetical protein
MAQHPQTTPRGLWAGAYVVSSDGMFFSPYSTTTALVDSNSTALLVAGGVRVSGQANAMLTGNSTGLLVAGQVRVSGQKYVGANSTGFIFTAAAAKPSTRSAAKWAFITNSTGVNGISICTTGTTWKFVNVTTVLPT